ncbi:hypothetical protein AGMMS49940_18160 [Spirochaetia bacterium]|nr:hypothetical protein AGMMS49940_18160 [Spirochaetia bacterium]
MTVMLGKIALATVLALGMALVGCDNGSTGGGGGGGGGDPITSDLYGTYSVTSPSNATGHDIWVGPGTWSMSGHTINDSGTYTLSADQRTATLYEYPGSPTLGTVYINGTVLTGILNNYSGYPGTYTATKTSAPVINPGD